MHQDQARSSTGRSVACTYGAPPDFLWTMAALANFLRLSLLKAAHAVLGGATYRKFGSIILYPYFSLPSLCETWGTHPLIEEVLHRLSRRFSHRLFRAGLTFSHRPSISY